MFPMMPNKAIGIDSQTSDSIRSQMIVGSLRIDGQRRLVSMP